MSYNRPLFIWASLWAHPLMLFIIIKLCKPNIEPDPWIIIQRIQNSYMQSRRYDLQGPRQGKHYWQAKKKKKRLLLMKLTHNSMWSLLLIKFFFDPLVLSPKKNPLDLQGPHKILRSRASALTDIPMRRPLSHV